MIIDCDKFCQVLKSSLLEKLKTSGRKGYVIEQDGTVASVLLEHLVSQLPCHHHVLTIHALPGLTSSQSRLVQLEEVAEKHSLLILGNLSKEEVFFCLYAKNYRADFLPWGSLYQSDLSQLARFCNLVTPSVDSSWTEMEWAIRQNNVNGLILSSSPPSTHKVWGGYTGTQRILIGKLWARAAATQHKRNLHSILDLTPDNLLR